MVKIWLRLLCYEANSMIHLRLVSLFFKPPASVILDLKAMNLLSWWRRRWFMCLSILDNRIPTLPVIIDWWMSLPICDWAIMVALRSQRGEKGRPSSTSLSPCNRHSHSGSKEMVCFWIKPPLFGTYTYFMPQKSTQARNNLFFSIMCSPKCWASPFLSEKDSHGWIPRMPIYSPIMILLAVKCFKQVFLSTLQTLLWNSPFQSACPSLCVPV